MPIKTIPYGAKFKRKAEQLMEGAVEVVKIFSDSDPKKYHREFIF